MLTGEQIKFAKSQGFLRDKRSLDKFSARILTRNGRITATENKVVSEAAEKFGDGYVMMTTRLSLEIGGVPFENIEPLQAFLKEHNLKTGGTGAKVRPVVSCKGTVCPFGLIDTFSLSEKIHNQFFEGMRDIELPHKFKIAVGGCPNNCVKPNLNDVGIMGQRYENPNYEKDVDNRKYLNGYAIFIGGRWGRAINIGQKLNKVFTDEASVLDAVEKLILFFKENGNKRERFSDTIKRLGFENVEKAILEA